MFLRFNESRRIHVLFFCMRPCKYLTLQHFFEKPLQNRKKTGKFEVVRMVEDTSAWRTGLRVWAAAATIGAEPSPDSLEKSPRAIP